MAFIKSINTGGVTTAMTTSSEVTIAPKNPECDHNRKQWRGDDTHRVEEPSRGGPSAQHNCQSVAEDNATQNTIII